MLNKKSNGKCCALFQSDSIYEYLRQVVNQRRHLFKDNKRVKVVKTSCLGQCAIGPNIFIVPDNIWYTFSCIEDIDDFINIHFIQGKIVDRLINHGIYYEYINPSQ